MKVEYSLDAPTLYWVCWEDDLSHRYNASAWTRKHLKLIDRELDLPTPGVQLTGKQTRLETT